jgi:hypothetical protein
VCCFSPTPTLFRKQGKGRGLAANISLLISRISVYKQAHNAGEGEEKAMKLNLHVEIHGNFKQFSDFCRPVDEIVCMFVYCR